MPNLHLRDKLIAVAPMMAWTDRHCRFYTPVVQPKCPAVYRNDYQRCSDSWQKTHQLDFDSSQHPVAVPPRVTTRRIWRSAQPAQQWGYDEINLNAGCPSDRYREAPLVCLMGPVGRSLHAAMIDVVDIPVNVARRTGTSSRAPTSVTPMQNSGFRRRCSRRRMRAHLSTCTQRNTRRADPGPK